MCTSVVSCSDVVVNIIFFLYVYIFYIISPVFIFLFKKMPILQQEEDACGMRRFSVSPRCSEGGRAVAHTRWHSCVADGSGRRGAARGSPLPQRAPCPTAHIPHGPVSRGIPRNVELFLYLRHSSVAKTLNRQQRCYVF